MNILRPPLFVRCENTILKFYPAISHRGNYSARLAWTVFHRTYLSLRSTGQPIVKMNYAQVRQLFLAHFVPTASLTSKLTRRQRKVKESVTAKRTNLSRTSQTMTKPSQGVEAEFTLSHDHYRRHMHLVEATFWLLDLWQISQLTDQSVAIKARYATMRTTIFGQTNLQNFQDFSTFVNHWRSRPIVAAAAAAAATPLLLSPFYVAQCPWCVTNPTVFMSYSPSVYTSSKPYSSGQRTPRPSPVQASNATC